MVSTDPVAFELKGPLQIMLIQDISQAGVCYVVNDDGKSINIWEGSWLPNMPNFRVNSEIIKKLNENLKQNRVRSKIQVLRN